MANPAPIKVTILGVDKLSSITGAAGKNLGVFAGKVQGIGKGLRTAGAGLLGLGIGAAAATGLTAIPGQILRIEKSLVSLGNTGNLTKEQLTGIGGELKTISRATNQSQEALLGGLSTLVAKGLDPTKAVELLRPVGKAATAAEADVNDLANATFTVYNNLKVPIGDVSKALDIMAASGKEGSFELKDMAREFPALTASAQSLGIKGVSGVARLGAALQVASLGAGSTAEAANNLANFMKAITSQTTVQAFAEQGLDIKKFLEDGAEAAKQMGKEFDPIEAVVAEMARVTKGDPFEIGKVFRDTQALNFLKPAIQNIEEYRRIRDVTAKADGVIERDFSTQMETRIEKWNRFKISLATADIKPLSSMLNIANKALDAFNGNSQTASLVINGITAAVVGGGALIALGQLFLSLKNIAGGLIMISKILPILGTAIMGHPLLALAAALVGIGAFAYAQAKKAGDESGTEGLRRGSDARKILDEAGAKTPLADKVAAMHQQWGDRSAFAGVKPVPASSANTSGNVQVDVNMKGVPKGTEVKTKASKGMTINTDVEMGFAFSR